MTKQIILSTIFIFIIHFIFAQEILLEQNIKLKSNLESHIINHQDNYFLLQLDKKNINFHSLGRNYKIAKSQNSPKSLVKNFKFLDYSMLNESCFLYFTNYADSPGLFYNNSPSYVALEFDIKNEEVKRHTISIELSKEITVSTFSENGKFYLLTIKKKSSELSLYVVEGKKIKEKKTFDLSDYKFGEDQEKNLYESIKDKVTESKTTTIEYDDLYLNQKAYKHHKVYHDSKFLHLTDDSRGTGTKIISINLEDFTIDVKEYEHGKCNCHFGMLSMDTNSFMMDNHLYQLVICNRAIYVSVFDLLKGERIQSFQATKDEIVSLNSASDKTEITVPFFTLRSLVAVFNDHVVLKRIARNPISISTYKKEENVEISIGGMKITKTSMASSTIPNTPAIYSYGSSYLYTTHFKSFLKYPSFEYVASPKEYALDKINTFMIEEVEATDADVHGETMYTKEDGVLFGYYSKSKKKYYLMNFLN